MAKEGDKTPKVLEPRFLVIDPDETWREGLKKEFERLRAQPTPETPKPMTGGSLREAQKTLSDRDYDYLAAFINPAMGAPSWIATVKSAHQYRPTMPVFILYDQPPKLSNDELTQLGIAGFVKKPVDYKQLTQAIGGQGPAEALLPGAQSAAPKGPDIPAQPKEPAQNPDDFISVDLKTKIGSATSLFDLFVRLSSGNFVQVLKSGDKLSQDRIDKYREHGAEALYVKKEAQGSYLAFCDQIIAKMLKDPAMPIEAKGKEILSLGAETSSFLWAKGLNAESMVQAEKFVSNTTQLLLQLTTPSGEARDWITDIALYDHGTSVCTIAGLMLRNIGVQNEATFNALGLACYLHDVGLVGHSDIQHEDLSKMNEDQKKRFLEHPETGASKVAALKGAPSAIHQAIKEHHLRADGSGFPKTERMIDLSLIAEAVGIADEFSKLISAAKSDSRINPFEAIIPIANAQFSKRISSAFLRSIKK